MMTAPSHALALASLCAGSGCTASIQLIDDAAMEATGATGGHANSTEDLDESDGHPSPPPATPGAAIALPALWRQAEALEDPFDDRPGTVTCNNGWGEEFGTFEVNTQDCNYMTAVQPSLVPLTAGTQVLLQLSHNVLTAETPAEAHVALSLAEHELWSAHFPIPAEPGVYSYTLKVPVDRAEGVPVWFHIHNHGFNSWRLLSLAVAK